MVDSTALDAGRTTGATSKPFTSSVNSDFFALGSTTETAGTAEGAAVVVEVTWTGGVGRLVTAATTGASMMVDFAAGLEITSGAGSAESNSFDLEALSVGSSMNKASCSFLLFSLASASASCLATSFSLSFSFSILSNLSLSSRANRSFSSRSALSARSICAAYSAISLSCRSFSCRSFSAASLAASTVATSSNRAASLGSTTLVGDGPAAYVAVWGRCADALGWPAPAPADVF
mmetsp:Transcript_34318/g.59000  ORF Transcript_34318/g.59000 Transcript_34318/m.59000 type:complete len:234 (-) Transcript_34318:1102-1803(-)